MHLFRLARQNGQTYTVASQLIHYFGHKKDSRGLVRRSASTPGGAGSYQFGCDTFVQFGVA